MEKIIGPGIAQGAGIARRFPGRHRRRNPHQHPHAAGPGGRGIRPVPRKILCPLLYQELSPEPAAPTKRLFSTPTSDYLKNILNKDEELPPEQYMQKMTYARFRRNRTILLAILLLAVLALLGFLLLGPPRLLDKVARSPPAVPLRRPALFRALAAPGGGIVPERAAAVARAWRSMLPAGCSCGAGARKWSKRPFARAKAFRCTATS